MYYLYLLRCADDSLYTGITTDPKRRLNEHNATKRGAKYTRARRPVVMLFVLPYPDRSSASKAEAALKKLPPSEKIRANSLIL